MLVPSRRLFSQFSLLNALIADETTADDEGNDGNLAFAPIGDQEDADLRLKLRVHMAELEHLKAQFVGNPGCDLDPACPM